MKLRSVMAKLRGKGRDQVPTGLEASVIPDLPTVIRPNEGPMVVPDTEAAEVIARNLQGAANDLERLYYSHRGHLAFKWHHYLKVYDRYLGRYRNRPLRLLEIGVMDGGSLEIWRKYFGQEAVIFGIDISERCAAFDGHGGAVRIGDQSDTTFLEKTVLEMGGVDVVIDDGSHIASHQRASFRTLFPMLSPDGIYICEDVHTAYWEGWEGGLQRPGTFIERAKGIVDQMHGWYAPVPTSPADLDFLRSVQSVSFFDSMVIIEKGQKERPYAVAVR